jgi:hypothetical protein
MIPDRSPRHAWAVNPDQSKSVRLGGKLFKFVDHDESGSGFSGSGP